MANIKSQIKRNRQNEVRHERNKAIRTSLKTHMKKVHLAVEAGNREDAEATYREAARQLDKAAQKGIVHGNYAANKKSKMAKHLGSL